MSAYKVCSIVLIIAMTYCIQAMAHYDRAKFKALVSDDTSNDEAVEMDAKQLINYAGFEYEEHYVIADDGYVTQLLRLINPKADRRQLKWPPVMLFHGANIDNAAYLLASTNAHHPEKYPRDESDGPMTSSTRSLAFMLANNGYDVWLMSTRGSNKQNQAFLNEDEIEEARQQHDWKPSKSNFRLVKKNRDKYWSYGLDEIIKYELREQIDKVRSLTNSDEVSIFSFSLSTPTTMAFLAANPDYAKKVRHYTQMAPAIAADHFTAIGDLYFEKICPHFKTRGIGFTPSFLVKPVVRQLVFQFSKSHNIRYSLVLKFLNALFGPSEKYQTNLELNFVARIFQPVSFKSIQHYCKNSRTKKLTKFDYGEKKNELIYHEKTPPEYKIDTLEVQNWLVISGTNDALADANTVQRLIEKTRKPEPVHIQVAGFNHADFLAGVENARYVNEPYLAELESTLNSARVARWQLRKS
uniref:Lipase member K n=1 Tax=Aceria tosichella TaxID=561515 RepID=A0A6G1SG02_9ACAR